MAERIPILKIEDCLVASIQIELYDKVALQFQQDVLEVIHRTGARGLLIDITAVAVVDSFMGRMIHDTGAMAKMLGAETVVVGLQPAVAITLMELGLELPGIHTSLNLEKGLGLLRELAAQSKAR